MVLNANAWRLRRVTPRGPTAPTGRARAVAGGAVPALLVLATGLAFAPTLGNGFVAWDDARNFLENREWRGLGPAQLAWIATASHGGHYMPVTWLTFAVDYTLWGLDPRGYHLTSLVIHAVAVVLCYAVARRLIGQALAAGPLAARAGAAVAALLFGLHPLRVESVAWATERRDVVSGALFLVTVLCHLGAAAATGARRREFRVASIAAHAGAVLSKAITVTAPAVLLVLDVYPLRRLPPDPRRWLDPGPRRVLIEKLPYLLLSAAATALALRAQILDGGVRLVAPWPGRVANVLYSVWFYLTRTLVPVGLSPLHEAPARIDPLEARFVLSAAGVALVALAAWLLRARRPAVAAVGVAYVITLAPVSGVFPLGELLVADRYSYVPCMGFGLLAGGALASAADRGPRARLVGALLLAAAALAALGVQTWRQTFAWRDTLSLWTAAVAASPDCGLCHLNLGHSLLERAAPEAALPHFVHAVAIRPDRALSYRGLGKGLEALGRRDAAIASYREGLARVPAALPLGLALATALVAQDRLAEVTEALAAPSRFYPPMGLVRYYEQAVARRPADPVPRLALVQAWLRAGDADRARATHEQLRRLHPGLAALVAPALGRGGPAS